LILLNKIHQQSESLTIAEENPAEDLQESQKKRKYSVPAVEITFRILRLLSRNRFRESTLTEIANALSLAPATCYRILHLLEELSIVRYEKNKKRYTLGPYLVVLGERAKEHLDYISIIMPYLESITKETGLTSVLVNRVGEDNLTFIAKVEGADYGINVSIGRHFSITDGAYGKCFLAYMDKKERKYFLRNSVGLKTFTEEEIVKLDHEFEEIKSIGYASTYGEYIKGICGVAVPIFIDDSNVEMSVSLIGLTAQITKEDIHSYGLLIRNAVEEITQKIRG
jgi:DNA-binding IclR family transcriptional regulator